MIDPIYLTHESLAAFEARMVEKRARRQTIIDSGYVGTVERAQIIMAPVDAMPKPWRELVHEYGIKAQRAYKAGTTTRKFIIEQLARDLVL